jgi:hypothetical protein
MVLAMTNVFELRFEGTHEERVFLIASAPEELWSEVQKIIDQFDDVHDFDCVTLRRLRRTLVLQDPLLFGPRPEGVSENRERRNSKDLLL